MEKSCTARKAADDKITRHMPFACWITNTTLTHRNIKNLLLFHDNNSYVNALQCYVYMYIGSIVEELIKLRPQQCKTTVLIYQRKERCRLDGWNALDPECFVFELLSKNINVRISGFLNSEPYFLWV